MNEDALRGPTDRSSDKRIVTLAKARAARSNRRSLGPTINVSGYRLRRFDESNWTVQRGRKRSYYHDLEQASVGLLNRLTMEADADSIKDLILEIHRARREIVEAVSTHCSVLDSRKS